MDRILTAGILSLTVMCGGNAMAQVKSGDFIKLKNGYQGASFYKYLDVAIVQPNRTPLKNSANAKGGLFFCTTAEGGRHTKWKIQKVSGSGPVKFGDKVYLWNPVRNLGYLDMQPKEYKDFGGDSAKHQHNPVFVSLKKDRSDGSSSQWIIKKSHDQTGSGAVDFNDTVWFESAMKKGFFLDTNMTAASYKFLTNPKDKASSGKTLLIFGTRNPTDSKSQHWKIEKP